MSDEPEELPECNPDHQCPNCGHEMEPVGGMSTLSIPPIVNMKWLCPQCWTECIEYQ